MRTKVRITASVVLLALLVGCIAGGRLLAFRVWEAAMFGPYTGTPFAGSLEGEASSLLELGEGAVLELHPVPGRKVPVLALRRAGRVEWTRVLQPERTLAGGQTETTGIREAELVRRVFTRSGTRVLFNCDWDWGGREGGLIYLKPDQSFDHFSISW